jgi:hypothetical protein
MMISKNYVAVSFLMLANHAFAGDEGYRVSKFWSECRKMTSLVSILVTGVSVAIFVA